MGKWRPPIDIKASFILFAGKGGSRDGGSVSTLFYCGNSKINVSVACYIGEIIPYVLNNSINGLD